MYFLIENVIIFYLIMDFFFCCLEGMTTILYQKIYIIFLICVKKKEKKCIFWTMFRMFVVNDFLGCFFFRIDRGRTKLFSKLTLITVINIAILGQNSNIILVVNVNWWGRYYRRNSSFCVVFFLVFFVCLQYVLNMRGKEYFEENLYNFHVTSGNDHPEL